MSANTVKDLRVLDGVIEGGDPALIAKLPKALPCPTFLWGMGMFGVFMGALLVVLGAGWLIGQLLVGTLGVPPLDGVAREHDPSLYWQFVYLAPGLLLALGAFLLRYRIRSFAGVCRERLNCAAFLLVSAGLALVAGKLSNLLLGNP